MRIPQKPGKKGSLKWIQMLINGGTNILDDPIIEKLKVNTEKINWLSPLKSDGYAEYRDDDFLKILGIEEHKEKLHKFWPKRGPQWDALGEFDNKKCCFIVEAKANIEEMISKTKASSQKSIDKIRNSLYETQNYLNCKPIVDWESYLYQYANRIAHLYFLRCICNVNAYLVFLYFLNDYTHISTTRKEWDVAINLHKQFLGLKRHKLQKYIAEIFIDVNKIK